MGYDKEIRPKIWYDYMKFLARKVGFDKKQYYNLVKKLHDTDFVWSKEVEMDENRANDGLYFRQYFFKELGLSKLCDFEYPCSVLESLVALSIRMEDEYIGQSYFDESGANSAVFEMFLKNLGLFSCRNDKEMDENLQIWMKRRYGDDGFGSIFRLKYPKKGFNEMEIWNQMKVFLTQFNVENVDDILTFL